MESLSTFLLFLNITRLTKTKDNFSYNFHQLSAVYYINKLYLYIYVICSSQLYILYSNSFCNSNSCCVLMSYVR